MRRASATALAGVLVMLTACSGGEARLTKEEFLKQGNVICARVNAIGIDASDDGTSPEAIKKFINETFVPQTTKGIDELDALRPPSDLQSAVDTMLVHARAVVAAIDKQADTDPSAILNQTDPFAEVGKEAVNIGLTACG